MIYLKHDKFSCISINFYFYIHYTNIALVFPEELRIFPPSRLEISTTPQHNLSPLVTLPKGKGLSKVFFPNRKRAED